MELTSLSQRNTFVFRHPYLISAFLCFFTAVFTFGNQTYFSAEAILVIAFISVVFLYKKIKKSECRAKNLKFAVLTVLIGAFAILFNAFPNKGEVILIAGLIAVIAAFLKMYKKKQITPGKVEILIFLFAFLMYISYILYTSCTKRQVDVGQIFYTNSHHAGYINYFYENWLMLPDFDPREKWQFYHAPLWHMTSALWIRLFTTFGITYDQAFESIQVLSLFCAFCIVITSYKIFKYFRLNGYALVMATAVVAFCNTTVMLSGSINNDIMMTAFETGAIYCALKWYRNRNTKNIVKTALCIGLGMMTKISAVIVAFPIAFLFIYAFFKDIRNFKKYIKQFLVFLAVCVPIGLWFPIYNYIRFGVPLGYVPVSDDTPIECSVIQRLFDFSLYQFKYPIQQPSYYLEFNPLISLFKSSTDLQRLELYLEDFWFPLSLALYSTIVIGVISFVFMIFSLFSKRINVPREYRIYMVIFYAVLMVSYYVFCIKYPAVCTENIRYVYPVILIGALFAGMMFKYKFKNKVFGTVMKSILAVAVIVFCISSIITFVSMGVLPE